MPRRVAAAPERTSCPYNDGIWVTGNIFLYIRDNPVELEDWATNAFIAQNQFHNAHAWLSFDGMGGGPVYVYGNRGWFDDRPAGRWSKAINGETWWRQETVARPPHGYLIRGLTGGSTTQNGSGDGLG